MIVDMPIYASHHDPEFFPDPARFDPERFLKDNAKDILPHTYRPFGGTEPPKKQKALPSLSCVISHWLWDIFFAGL